MDREIKFRAWDGKKMFLPSDGDQEFYDRINIGLNGTLRVYGAEGEDEFPNFELMQFTGLKFNDMEIYEGDVFNHLTNKRHPEGGYIVGTTDFHPETAEVVRFDNGAFHAGNMLLRERFFWYERHHWKLLGNIYQHPELLEQPQ